VHLACKLGSGFEGAMQQFLNFSNTGYFQMLYVREYLII